MKKSILAASITMALASTVQADLPPNVRLDFDQGVKTTTTFTYNGNTYTNTTTAGSFFSMDADVNGTVAPGEITVIGPNNGVIVDGVTTQAASGSHGGAPGCLAGVDPGCNGGGGVGETPDIDAPWLFFSNTGMHQTTSPVSASTDDGAGNVELDLTGWNVTWNLIPSIPMGGDAANFGVVGNTGLGTMTCTVGGVASDCIDGADYALDYNATVPLNDASGFGGVPYVLHLEGTITDLNAAPVASNNPLGSSVTPNGAVRIDAIGNIVDTDGVDTSSVITAYTGSRTPVPTIDTCTAAATPHALCQAEGDIVYTDNEGTDTGLADTFTYTVMDNLGKPIASPVVVEVDVITGNLPPQCGNSPTTLVTNKNTALVGIDVASFATDSDGIISPGTLVTSNPLNGGAVHTGGGSVDFTPDLNVVGAASFEYTVDDNSGDTCATPGVVSLRINDLPVAADDNAGVDRNSAVGVLIDVKTNDTDSDGTIDDTSVNITADVSNGSTGVDGTGRVTYIPSNGFSGTDQFTYTIDDNDGATSNEATVTITVSNAAPNAVNDTALIDTFSETSVDIDVTANDTDSDGTINNTTVAITGGPANGGATINPTTGLITYTPDAGFIGSDTVTYTVDDNEGATSNEATITISVSNTNPDVTVLDPNATLTLITGNTTGTTVSEPADGNGSWFHMEVSPGQLTFVSLQGRNGLHLGEDNLQLANQDNPDIDEPWSFFGNLGIHQTTIGATVLTDDGQGSVTIDMSGWDVSWNKIVSIPLNARAQAAGFVDSVGQMTCANDCALGDSYILEYSATVPEGDPSSFGNVKYFLHLEGIISDGIPTIGGGNPLASFGVTEIAAVDGNGGTVQVVPGSTADAVGNTSGIGLSPEDVGLKDPSLNTDDGQQCIGGCIDFVITGVTTTYIDLVFKLSEVLPSGATYRKLVNGQWQDFNQTQGGLIGSAASNGGTCQGPDGVFDVGLREGYDCVYMRIFDNGPNDADSTVGTIADPSGALLAGSPNTPAGSSSGCSISNAPVKLVERADWLVLAGFIALMGLVSFKRRRQNS